MTGEEDRSVPRPNYNGWRVGLGCFGSLLVLAGGFSLLSGMLSALSILWIEPAHNPSYSASGPAIVLFYTVLASIMVALGFGSFMARRWARALTLILSVYALVLGVMIFALVSWFTPPLLQQLASSEGADPEISSLVTWFLLIFLFVVSILVPASFALFYRTRGVKATCETYDPHTRWTDRRPLPVLGAAMVLFSFAWGALSTIGSGFGSPLLGFPLQGPSGALAALGLAALYLYLAWAVYQQRSGAWLIAVILAVFLPVSTMVTSSDQDWEKELLQAAPEEADFMDAFVATGVLDSGLVTAMTFIPSVIWILYLLFVRRHFQTDGAGEYRTPP